MSDFLSTVTKVTMTILHRALEVSVVALALFGFLGVLKAILNAFRRVLDRRTLHLDENENLV